MKMTDEYELNPENFMQANNSKKLKGLINVNYDFEQQNFAKKKLDICCLLLLSFLSVCQLKMNIRLFFA